MTELSDADLAARAAFNTLPASTGQGSHTKPQTGDEYLASLRDGRCVYIYGEKVADVTVHPAFRNTARMVARLYDAMHDPEKSKGIMVP